MQSEPDTAATTRRSDPIRDVPVIVIALVVAVVLSRVVAGLARTGGLPSPLVQVLLADLAVWVPLGLAVAWSVRRTSAGALVRRLGLGWADVVAAVGIVIVCRAVDVVLSIAFTGSTGLVPAPTLGPPDVGLLVVSAIGIVVVSPVLEEVVFRGLFQRRLAAELTPRTRFLAVLVTAFLFALLHLLLGAGGTTLGGFQVFVTTFLLGVLTGTLVAMTDRIGGAVLAHVLFNAVAVVATWPR